MEILMLIFQTYINPTRFIRISLCIVFISTLASLGIAQTQPELETGLMKMGRVWTGVTANGDKGTFDYRAGFFPNDFDIFGLGEIIQTLFPLPAFLPGLNYR